MKSLFVVSFRTSVSGLILTSSFPIFLYHSCSFLSQLNILIYFLSQLLQFLSVLLKSGIRYGKHFLECGVCNIFIQIVKTI